MVQFTHQNHVVYGFGDGVYNFRKNYDERFWLKFGRCQRMPMRFKDECIATARLMGEKKSVIVALSGGRDSEVAALSLMAAGVPFECVTMRYLDSAKNIVLNEHDIEFASAFCKSQGLKHSYFDVDIRQFFSTGLAYEYAKKCRTFSFITTAMAWFLDVLDGFVVLGAGDPCIYNPTAFAPSRWVYGEDEYTTEWMRGFMNRGRDGSCGFFYHTPEMMMSFLLSDQYQGLLRGERKDSVSLNAKYALYEEAFGELAPRGTYTGCEKFEDEWWNRVSLELSRMHSSMPRSANYRLGETYAVQELVEMMLPENRSAQ